MVKRGSIKGTLLKIMMVNGRSLDTASIVRLASKEVPDASHESIRAGIYNLVKEGYLEKSADGYYKATQACKDGMVDGPMSEATINVACTKKDILV